MSRGAASCVAQGGNPGNGFSIQYAKPRMGRLGESRVRGRRAKTPRPGLRTMMTHDSYPALPRWAKEDARSAEPFGSELTAEGLTAEALTGLRRMPPLQG